jgi:hypothetical protein
MADEIRWKRTIATLLTGGVVGVFLAPVIAPVLSRWSRPAAKAALRAGMAVYERGRQSAAELRELVEDTAAEIAAERADQPADSPVPHVAPIKKGERAAPVH